MSEDPRPPGQEPRDEGPSGPGREEPEPPIQEPPAEPPDEPPTGPPDSPGHPPVEPPPEEDEPPREEPPDAPHQPDAPVREPPGRGHGDPAGAGSASLPRPVWLVALGLVLVAGCVALVWSRLDSVAAGLTSWGGSSSTTPASPEEAPPLLEMTEDMREVLLFFPRADGLGLGVEPSEVFDLNNPSARGKLVLERLAAGPGSDTLGLALPQEALVRELWISPSGTAYVDFSRQLGRNHPGGTTGEMLTVYAIINSLVYNLPEVRKVQILMEGREVDTLAGHLALWLPLGADLSLVVSETDRPSSNPPRAAATF